MDVKFVIIWQQFQPFLSFCVGFGVSFRSLDIRFGSLGHRFGSRCGLRLDNRDYDKQNHAFGSEMHSVIIDFSGLGNNKSSLSVILCIVCAAKFYIENGKKEKNHRKCIQIGLDCLNQNITEPHHGICGNFNQKVLHLIFQNNVCTSSISLLLSTVYFYNFKWVVIWTK